MFLQTKKTICHYPTQLGHALPRPAQPFLGTQHKMATPIMPCRFAEQPNPFQQYLSETNLALEHHLQDSEQHLGAPRHHLWAPLDCATAAVINDRRPSPPPGGHQTLAKTGRRSSGLPPRCLPGCPGNRLPAALPRALLMCLAGAPFGRRLLLGCLQPRPAPLAAGWSNLAG